MSGHYRQAAAARQEGQSTAESNTVSVQEPQCGRCLWESGCRVPLGEGQASLGEALVTVHTCRLLLQPRRRLKVRSPTCNHCPREGGQSRVVAFSNVFCFFFFLT